jgi:hypothetical protein
MQSWKKALAVGVSALTLGGEAATAALANQSSHSADHRIEREVRGRDDEAEQGKENEANEDAGILNDDGKNRGPSGNSGPSDNPGRRGYGGGANHDRGGSGQDD